MLDKPQKPTCMTVGPLIAASLEPLADQQNAACQRAFYRYNFGGCLS